MANPPRALYCPEGLSKNRPVLEPPKYTLAETSEHGSALAGVLIASMFIGCS
jgi:hypothetical protein